ncbi:MAG: hypothetical protein M1379_09290 [Firmicutes bacterium]|nr:hypothetical protein [Bacillota bacterium]
MQLNIYIPKEKSAILTALEQTAQVSGRPKNELVMEALERYLPTITPISLGKFDLGEVKSTSRADIYEGRLER